ncbi:abortive infection family protein [Streptomyces virginiae]|uniref:abortive infection family protein n=1 Tax=Streptomyces virginiae TaxID=1961 RepID=UPI00366065DF
MARWRRRPPRGSRLNAESGRGSTAGPSLPSVGVADLRNQGFGSGHGQASAPSGLGVRHARLTVNAAVTWCEPILDTMADQSVPWRNSRPATGPTLTKSRA